MTAIQESRTQELVEFDGLLIAYDDRVLAPRPWTVAQSMWAAEIMEEAPPGPVLELCAGAGQIGLAAVSRTARSLVCVDADPAAALWCRRNADSAGLGHRVAVREGMAETALEDDERFAVVIADPPCIRTSETHRFRGAPLLAVDGGMGGIDVALACLNVIERHLASGGSAILQLATPGQVDLLVAEAEDRGAVHLVDLREFPGRGVLARLDTVPGGR